jgi:hypothetical protein
VSASAIPTAAPGTQPVDRFSDSAPSAQDVNVADKKTFYWQRWKYDRTQERVNDMQCAVWSNWIRIRIESFLEIIINLFFAGWQTESYRSRFTDSEQSAASGSGGWDERCGILFVGTVDQHSSANASAVDGFNLLAGKASSSAGMFLFDQIRCDSAFIFL